MKLKSNKGHKRPMVIGLKKPSAMSNAERFALSLATRCQSPAILTHVCEPWQARAWLAYLPGDAAQTELAANLEREIDVKAKEQIESLIKKETCDISLKGKILEGEPAERLASYAATSDAWLIASGAADVDYRLIPAGWSMPLGLAQKAAMPVMIAPESARPISASKRLNILVADDLGASHRDILRTTYELAMLCGNCEIYHLHVGPASERALSEILASSDYAQLERESGLAAGLSPEGFKDHLRGQITERLRHAFGSYYSEELQDRGVSYQPVVAFGKPSDVIERIIGELHADLIVFGPHKTIRQHPLSLGKLPLRTMLNKQVPIIIAR